MSDTYRSGEAVDGSHIYRVNLVDASAQVVPRGKAGL